MGKKFQNGNILFAITLLFFTSVFTQDAMQDNYYTVKFLVGKVQLQTKDGKWKALKINQKIRGGEAIQTYIESRVDLVDRRGTLIKIDENSVVQMEKLLIDASEGIENSQISIKMGRLISNIRKLSSRRSKFEFKTPTATATIRGTIIGIHVSKKHTVIDVYKGRVGVKPEGEIKEIEIKDLQRGIVRRNKKGVQVIQFMIKGTQIIPKESREIVPEMEIPFMTSSADTTEESLYSTQEKPSVAGDTAVTDSAKTDTTAQIDSAAADSSAVVDSSIIDSIKADTMAQVDSAALDSSAVADSLIADSTAIDSAQIDTTTGIDSIKAEPTAKDSADSAGQAAVADTADKVFSWSLELELPEMQVTSKPDFVLKGKAHANAAVLVNGRKVAVSSTGQFTHICKLNPGINTIKVAAKYNDEEQSQKFQMNYVLPLKLEVGNLSDGAIFTSPEIDVAVTVTEGATFSVNDKEGVTRITLNQGSNVVTVRAWNEIGTELEREFTVTYKPSLELVLNVNTPQNGPVQTTSIMVSGSTLPDAEVQVQGTGVSVDATGAFRHTFSIPSETGEYEIEVVASYQGKEKQVIRTITYEEPKAPLSLVVSSPADGTKIKQSSFTVMGLARGATEVNVNGTSVPVDKQGNFNTTIRLNESDIGDYTLTVSASNDDEEQSKDMSLEIDITSAQINTSVPFLTFSGQVQHATKRLGFSVMARDNTPDDKILLSVTINGDVNTVDDISANSSESFDWFEGENTYQIKAEDQAKNQSNVLSGKVICLPRPFIIRLNEPASENYRIGGIPPFPDDDEIPVLDIEVEIDDGLNDMPENILYVRAISSGSSVKLVDNDYIYTGQIEIKRGNNHIEIVSEDIAGNRVTKTLNVLWRD